MTIFKTTDLISELQQQAESFLEKAVSQWQTMPPEKLLRQPEVNSWSAAQCLAHLNSYGHYYLPEIEKAIKTARQNSWAPSAQFRAGWVGNYFTKLMMPAQDGKKMKKMSAPKNHKPAADLDSGKVVSEFIEQQEKLLGLLDKAGEINIEKATVPISIARFIKLKLGDTFRFLTAHNQRHILQAEKGLAYTATQEKYLA